MKPFMLLLFMLALLANYVTTTPSSNFSKLEAQDKIIDLLENVQQLERKVLQNTRRKLSLKNRKRKARSLKNRKKNRLDETLKELKSQYAELKQDRALRNNRSTDRKIDDLNDRISQLEELITGKRKLQESESTESSGSKDSNEILKEVGYAGLGIGALGAGSALGMHNHNVQKQKQHHLQEKLKSSYMIESLMARDIVMIKKINGDLLSCGSRIETVRGNLIFSLDSMISDHADYRVGRTMYLKGGSSSKSDSDSGSDEDDAEEGEEDKRHRRHRKHHRRHKHHRHH